MCIFEWLVATSLQPTDLNVAVYKQVETRKCEHGGNNNNPSSDANRFLNTYMTEYMNTVSMLNNSNDYYR